MAAGASPRPSSQRQTSSSSSTGRRATRGAPTSSPGGGRAAAPWGARPRACGGGNARGSVAPEGDTGEGSPAPEEFGEVAVDVEALDDGEQVEDVAGEGAPEALHPERPVVAAGDRAGRGFLLVHGAQDEEAAPARRPAALRHRPRWVQISLGGSLGASARLTACLRASSSGRVTGRSVPSEEPRCPIAAGVGVRGGPPRAVRQGASRTR